MKPVELEILLRDNLSTGLNKVGSMVDGLLGKARKANAGLKDMEGEVTVLRNVIAMYEAQLEHLRAISEAVPIDLDQSENIAQIKMLEEQLEGLKNELQQLQTLSAQTKVTPGDIPQAQGKFNGLHNSIQQMAREMPSLAMGPQTFFMAISNNLPIFTDEVARARNEYNALVAAGGRGIPVWRQILKSLFSWQTALTTGIMLLVMYGDEIVAWAKDLLGAKKSLAETCETLDEFQKSVADTASGVLSTYDRLAKGWAELGNDMKAKEHYIVENRDAIDGLGVSVNNTAEAERLFNAGKDKFIESVMARARASAAMELASKEYKKAIEKMVEADALPEKKTYKAFQGTNLFRLFDKDAWLEIEYDNPLKQKKETEAEELFTSASELVTKYAVFSEKEREILKGIGIESTEAIIEGSVAAIEASIALKEQALKEATNAEDYNRISAEIKAEKSKLAAIISRDTSYVRAVEKAGQEVKQAERDAFNERREQDDEFYYERERNRIALEKDASKRAKMQRDLDNRIQLDQLEQERMDAVEAEKKRQKAIFDAQENAKQAKDANYVKKNFTDADIDQSKITEINNQYAALRDQTIKLQRQTEVEVFKEELAVMRDTLKEYGNFQQQKLAIAEEYAEKIKNATTEGEKIALGKERDSALAGVEAQELKASIDWGVVFGEFGGMFSGLIEPVLADAKKYMQTDEFKNADHDSQAAIVEAVQQMEQALGGADKVSFKKLGTDITAYQNALKDLKEKQSEYIGLYAELVEKQKAYATALEKGTKEEQDAAKQALDTAQANVDAAEQNMEAMQNTVNAAQQTMTQTATSLKTSMDGVIGGLQKIASGSAGAAFEGLIQLGNSAKAIGGKLGNAMGKVADRLESVPIVGWILSILDIFKDGAAVVIDGLLDSIFGAVAGIIEDVFNGELVSVIIDSVIQGVVNIFAAITDSIAGWFGGNFSLSEALGLGSSIPGLEESMENLKGANEDLTRAIDNLSEKMDDATTAEAADIYKEQLNLIDQKEANAKSQMSQSGSAYNNGLWGLFGEHSSNYHIDENMTSNDWKRISDIVGRDIDSAGDWWGLSSEEMAKVADEATDLYTKIKGYANDGYADAAKYMDSYIEFYKEREEAEKNYFEKVTGMNFDSVEDSFKNMLLNMEADASDAGAEIADSLLLSIVTQMMSDTYTTKLRDWYDKYVSYAKEDGLSEEEADELKAEYLDIYNQAAAERNEILKAMGIDDDVRVSQSGKAGSFNAMSQEQGTKLEGLFVSGQMHWASIDEHMEDVSVNMSVAVGHLRRIEENTGSCSTQLGSILATINKIKSDGLKVK